MTLRPCSRSDRRDIAAASWMGDGGAVVVSHDRAVALIDELRRQERLLGVVHSRRAALMVQFGDVRRRLDQQVIGELTAGGGREVRFRAATATPQASSPTGPA